MYSYIQTRFVLIARAALARDYVAVNRHTHAILSYAEKHYDSIGKIQVSVDWLCDTENDFIMTLFCDYVVDGRKAQWEMPIRESIAGTSFYCDLVDAFWVIMHAQYAGRIA